MKYKICTLLIGLLSASLSGNLFSQERELTLNENSRQKFDHYFYEALNAKAQNKFDEAFDLFRHCHALDSTNANVLVELGAYHNLMGEKSLGLSYLRKAVQYDPKNYYYNVILAGASKEMSLKQEVVDIYAFLLQTYPDKLDLYYELANAYLDNGELEEALKTFENLEKISGITDMTALNKFRIYTMMDKKEAAFDEVLAIVAKNPGNSRYTLLAGDLYLQDNQPEKALEFYQKTAETDSGNPSLILSMVNYYEKTGDKQAALEEMSKAVAGTQLEAETKLQLLARYVALLQQSKQDVKTANPLFQSFVEQHPNNSDVNLLYGEVLLLQNDTTAALNRFSAYAKANPQDPTGYEQMLRLALPDKLDKIIEITQSALQNIPEAPQFYFYLGSAYYQQQKHREALDVFEAGLKNAKFQNPLVESDFYGQIGDLNYFLKNKKAAFENYEKSLERNPQNLFVLNNYSYYLSLERKELDKAEKMSSITVKAEPTNPTYLDTYGWILFEQGAYVMAKIYIEKAVEYSKEEPSADIFEHHGDILAVTGETDKAVEQWQKAKALGSDSKTLDKKIKQREYIK